MNDPRMPAPQPNELSPQVLIALHETAAGWFMRRSEAGWTGADERALESWLAAAPLHREIFAELALVNHDLQQIPLALDPSWRLPVSQPAPRPAAAHATGGARRRGWAVAAVAACVSLLVGGGYGWQRWENTARYTLEVTTAQGESRMLDLPDGSRVALNVASRLTVRYYPHRRALVLDQGEAFFEVAADAGRPFTVDSGDSQVKVLGTAFNLRAAPPQFSVKVREGRVELRPRRAAEPGQVLVLGPGSGAAVDTTTGRTSRLAVSAAGVGGWRSGQLDFQRTPLATVVEELARYVGQPVVLAQPDLARLPVSGVAATARPEAFLHALPELLPLRVQQLADGSWRIARR